MKTQLFASSLLLSTVGLFAVDTNTKSNCINIKVVNVFGAMQESEQGKKDAGDLEKKFEKIAKEIKAESEKLETAGKELAVKRSTMNKDAINKEEARLTKMKRDLENKMQDSEGLLNSDRERVTGELAKKVEEAINAYAKTEQPDVIFDEVTGRPVYVSGKINITEDIKKHMNKEYAASKAKVGGPAVQKAAA